MWADVVSIEPMGELDEECTRLLSMLRQIEKHTTTAIMAYTEAHWRFEQWWMQYQIDVKLRCLLESFDTYGQAYIATCFGISVQELRMREQEYVHQKESKLGLLDDTRAWAKHLVNHEGKFSIVFSAVRIVC